jgi:hypothetical protein
MDEKVRSFLQANHLATMTTFRIDGMPHRAHVAVALVGGRLWSSGTERRMRTAFLRLNPSCRLLVFPTSDGGYATYHLGGPGSAYLGLETNVTILEGPDVPDLSVELFKVLQPQAAPGSLLWQGQARTYDEFRQIMRDEQRVIYQFEIVRAYGRY